MRRLFQLMALASVVGGVALLAGCQKESWNRKGSAREVKFGAAAHSSVDTRTEYMGYKGGDYENIKWLDTDRIRIYSPDAARRVAVETGPESEENPYYYWADYQVVPNSDPTTGTLKNLSNDGATLNPFNPGYDQGEVGNLYDVGNGLVWLNGGQATFYGAYPRKALIGIQEGSGSDVANGMFKFTLPRKQSFSEKGDMDYAFMTAKASASEGENVTLNFYPDFTAFEISLKCEAQGSEVKLKSFTIGTEQSGRDNNLNGEFTVNLSGAKSYSLPSTPSMDNKKVTVTPDSPVTIPAGGDEVEPLVFTVFALPRTQSNLYIQFNTVDSDGVEKSWKLDLKKNNAFIDFAACKKHRIYGLKLPNGWNFKYITLEGNVIDWKDVKENNLDTDNLPEASQFVVNGANNGRYYTSGDQTSPVDGRNATDYRQYWLMKSGVPATVTFKIMAPEGGAYEIVPQGDTGEFTVEGALTGNIAAKPASSTATSETTVVNLTITSTTTVADAVLYFKTYVTDKNGTKYSIDSETQLYDLRGYHYFVMNNSTTVQ